ncbi:hypothetical protein [Duncaniella dubosii]|uniref:hypothetical protein n=1 Tax=Duncaniella dubosii TaxID=2518971 RepID=UPI003F66EB71
MCRLYRAPVYAVSADGKTYYPAGRCRESKSVGEDVKILSHVHRQSSGAMVSTADGESTAAGLHDTYLSTIYSVQLRYVLFFPQYQNSGYKENIPYRSTATTDRGERGQEVRAIWLHPYWYDGQAI